jgi:hypothetical protein
MSFMQVISHPTLCPPIVSDHQKRDVGWLNEGLVNEVNMQVSVESKAAKGI